MKILVLNSGSSSLKYQLFDVNGDRYDVIAKGLAERIGIHGSLVSIKYANGEKKSVAVDLPTHNEALREVFNLLLDGVIKSLDEITAVGHRVVHGGENFKGSALVTEKVIEEIDELFEKLAQPKIEKIATEKTKEQTKEFTGYKEDETDNLDRLIETTVE